MNDTLDAEAEVQASADTSSTNLAALAAINELYASACTYSVLINQLKLLLEANQFRHLSKAKRNEMLDALLNQAGELEDAAKAAHRGLKKVRREHLPDDVADALIISGVNEW